MWVFAFNVLAVVFVPLLLGFFGWLATEFLGKKIAKFYSARADAIEALFFTENVSAIILKSDSERYYSAVDELRRCAARLEAVERNSTRLTRWYLSHNGYDLDKAVKGLTGLSNSLGVKGSFRPFNKTSVEIGLRLPRSYSSEELEKIQEIENNRGLS